MGLVCWGWCGRPFPVFSDFGEDFLFYGSDGCIVGFGCGGSLCEFYYGVGGCEWFCGVVKAIDGFLCEVVCGAGSGEGGEAIGGGVLHFGGFWGGARGIPPGYLKVYHRVMDGLVSSYC